MNAATTETRTRSWRWLLLALAAMLALVGAACDDTDSAGPERGASLEDVTSGDNGGDGGDAGVIETNDDTAAFFDDPNAFVGQEVVVSGEIQQVMGARIFTIGEEQHVLVIGAQTPSFNLEPSQVAQVRGIVGVYSADGDLNSALRSAIGADAFEPLTQAELDEIDASFDQQVFLTANNVDLIDADDQIGGGENGGGGGDDGLGDSDDEGL